MLASQETVSDTELLCIVDTMLVLGTETLAPNRGKPTTSLKPLPFSISINSFLQAPI